MCGTMATIPIPYGFWYCIDEADKDMTSAGDSIDEGSEESEDGDWYPPKLD